MMWLMDALDVLLGFAAGVMLAAVWVSAARRWPRAHRPVDPALSGPPRSDHAPDRADPSIPAADVDVPLQRLSAAADRIEAVADTLAAESDARDALRLPSPYERTSDGRLLTKPGAMN